MSHHKLSIITIVLLAGVLGSACDEQVSGNAEAEGAEQNPEFSMEQCPVPCEGTVGSSCEGSILVGMCEAGMRPCTDCAAENQKCIFDGVTGTHRCALRNRVSSVCIPQCSGLVCGPDSCGGTCGFCPQGGVCDAGKCWENGMSCEVKDEPLWCLGEVLASCVEQQLDLLDCAKLGRVCGRSETTGKIECLVLQEQ